MFDPSKYDTTDSQNENGGKLLFSEKIANVIKYLQSVRPLIIKECEIMESYIEKNPGSKAEVPFKEKLGGWSRILNGMDIVKEKYEVE